MPARPRPAERGFGFCVGRIRALNLEIGIEPAPKFVRALAPDPGQQLRDAFEGQFIARVGRQFEISRGVLDVRLLKKPDAAGDAERNIAPRQFKLQFERVKMRTIQHRHFVHVHSFLAQFQHALRHERGLLRRAHAGHQHRFRARLAGRGQILCELPDVRRDCGVGHVQYFRCAAVIRFYLVNFCVRMPFGKLHDVLEVRSAPRVDALGVVAHHHDVVMPRPQQVDQLGLQLVCVLVFIHQYELEPALILFGDCRIVPQQSQPQIEQVIKIHRVRGLFARDVAL